MIGTLAAWCVERTDLPARRVWAVLVVVPARRSRTSSSASAGSRSFPSIGGVAGAALVMTLGDLPARLPAGRGQPAQRRPGARGGRAQPRARARCGTFWRVTLGRSRRRDPRGLRARRAGPARRVRRVRDPRLPDVHDRDLHRVPDRLQLARRPPRSRSCSSCSACSCWRRGRCPAAAGARAAPDRSPRARRSGTGSGVAAGSCSRRSSLLVGLALGVPIGAIVYWILQSGNSTLPAASIVSAALAHRVLQRDGRPARHRRPRSRSRSSSVRYRRRATSTMLERSTYLVLAHAGTRHRARADVLQRALRRRAALPEQRRC